MIYNATKYTDVPNISLKEITIWYEPNIEISEQWISDKAKTVKTDKLILDIESWDSSDERYLDILRWINKARPDLDVGYYGVIPLNYPKAATHNTKAEYWNWRAINDNNIQLAGSVDTLYVVGYTYFSDPEIWKLYAINSIREARRFGKPVSIFLWPLYEKGVNDDYAYIGNYYWRIQLETAGKWADDVVIWGGWDHINGGPLPWDNSADWWDEFKKYENRP